MPSPVVIVVAMPCEARPIVERFGLRSVEGAAPFSVYAGEVCDLVVSGVGKVSAAAAVGYVHALRGSRRGRAWLNVGVAGHADRPVGEAVIGHKISDASVGRSWYPPLVFELPLPTVEVITVDEVVDDYPSAAVYEMEASGFYAVASRLSTAELVHCLKVVSDNRVAPVGELTAERIGELIAGRVDALTELIDQLGELAEEAAAGAGPIAEIEAIVARWHFSTTQRRRLERLLRRWRALDAGKPVRDHELDASRDAGEFLERLAAKLDAMPLRLGETGR